MSKKIYCLSILSILMFSCSNNNSLDKKSVDDIVKTRDLELIKQKRALVHAEYEKYAAELSNLDLAISELDINKKNILVSTLTLKDTSFTHFIEIRGNVETKENILIYPETQGVVTQVNVKAGQTVSKGQVLARIDDGGMGAQVAQAQTQLALSKTTFERQKNLWDQKIGSEIQYLQAKSAMESQQKVVSQLNSQLNKSLIRAPFSGTIDEVVVEKGKVVGPGQSLFRIVNLSNMYVTANVPENYIGKLKLGATVEVYLNSLGKNYQGKVRQIGNYINPENRTFSIEIGVPNSENLLRPNQVAVLKIEDYTNPKALLIPENILQEKADGSKIVYSVGNIDSKNTSTVTQKIVEIGYTSGAFIEIKSGLQVGDRIVTDGAKSLKNDDTVEVVK